MNGDTLALPRATQAVRQEVACLVRGASSVGAEACLGALSAWVEAGMGDASTGLLRCHGRSGRR